MEDETFFSMLGGCKTPLGKAARAKRGSERPCFEFDFSDQWKFSRRTKPTLSAARDFGGIVFDADLVALAQQARRPLARLEADLAWVALVVYLADRFAPRYPYGVRGPAFWRRRIHLRIPVSDSSVWKGVTERLIHTLEFLTEDDWSFEFTTGRAPISGESQEHLRKMRGTQIGWISLFSGGLDSLAGALHWLQNTNGAGLLVSGQTHNRIAFGQKGQVAELREHFPQRTEHVGVGYGVLSTAWPDLLRAEIELAAPLFADATVALLRRHVSEWRSFSKAIPPLWSPSLPNLPTVPRPWNPNYSTASTIANLVNA